MRVFLTPTNTFLNFFLDLSKTLHSFSKSVVGTSAVFSKSLRELMDVCMQ